MGIRSHGRSTTERVGAAASGALARIAKRVPGSQSSHTGSQPSTACPLRSSCNRSCSASVLNDVPLAATGERPPAACMSSTSSSSSSSPSSSSTGGGGGGAGCEACVLRRASTSSSSCQTAVPLRRVQSTARDTRRIAHSAGGGSKASASALDSECSGAPLRAGCACFVMGALEAQQCRRRRRARLALFAQLLEFVNFT
jgi:hypothetical protein